MKKPYLRGDMYYADLGEGVGSEQKGYRPVIIIQNNTGNKYSPTVIVAAISSKVGVKARLPTHYYIEAAYGLQMPSIVLLEQLRTIDKRRLNTYIGRLPEQHIRGINHALAISIGISHFSLSTLTLCLCSACADNFRDTGAFALRQTDVRKNQQMCCVYCGRRLGVDYEVTQTKQGRGGEADV